MTAKTTTPKVSAVDAAADALESIADTGAEALESVVNTGTDALDSIADFFAPPHMIARRRARRQLALLSDEQLAELGMTRAQVEAD
jgi:uncharacterized protein YjiS (DUF1127 family)